MGGGCRARHLSYSDAMEVAIITTIIPVEVDSNIVKAALDNALKVYRAVRRATGSCRKATLREAAQLLYDAATLRAAEDYSGVTASILAHTLLRLNGLRASMPWLLRVAATVCRDPDAMTPEDIAEALDAVVVEDEMNPPLITAMKFKVLLLIDEETSKAFSEALKACGGGA